jgi:hypothetical protein
LPLVHHWRFFALTYIWTQYDPSCPIVRAQHHTEKDTGSLETSTKQNKDEGIHDFPIEKEVFSLLRERKGPKIIFNCHRRLPPGHTYLSTPGGRA